MKKSFFIKNAGILKASGKDFLDFMNRMSTEDLRKFPLNEYRKTVLTTDKGRIVDLVYILNIENQPLLLCTFENTDKVKSHLDRYIIMDDVVLEKSPEEYFNIIITGDESEAASELFNASTELNKVTINSEGEILFKDNFRFKSLNVICKKDDLEKAKNKLKDFIEADKIEYEKFRIEAGLPDSENELNEQINPMECGLENYISFKKGCYIGQEVIARLDSQGKRPKQMIKIYSDSEIKKGKNIFDRDGKEAGFISSVVLSDNRYTGFGFIRNSELDFEKEYFAESGNEKKKINISKIN